MIFNRRNVAILTFVGVAVLAQDRPNIDKITVKLAPPDEAPLRPAVCKEHSYGYLHMGQRTALTPEEIGRYAVAALNEGRIVTLYPESKSGIYVFAKCPNDAR